MNSILLLAALAAPPDSTARVIRDTVYVEHVVIERTVNPQAAPAAIGKPDQGVKYVLSALLIGAGTYFIIHGENNPTRKLVVTSSGYKIDESTNAQVYLGSGLMGCGILVLAF